MALISTISQRPVREPSPCQANRDASATFFVVLLSLICVSCSSPKLPPIPDRLVVLTFDDGNKSDRTFVGPLLKEYGFGATFFINKEGSFAGDTEKYLSWEDVRWLHEAGFEIGNHTANHPDIRKLSKAEFAAELEAIEEGCVEHGIPRPVSFCYPGYHSSREAVEVIEERGYLFARRGVAPEFPASDHGDRGPAYNPNEDHPLLVPTTGASGPNWNKFEDFVSIVNQANDGQIAVLTFHGVPTPMHPWVNTDPQVFRRYMDYLRDNDFTVIAMRDLAKYVNPEKRPRDPYEAVFRRLSLVPGELRSEYLVNPLGIDVAQPRFSWQLEASRRGQVQSAYQILVASSEENIARNVGDLWDSGKVASQRAVNVAYEGKPLLSGQRCWWKVRVWNRPGEDGELAGPTFADEETLRAMRVERSGDYSAPATFQMGLLQSSDWQAQWIAHPKKETSSPLLRKEFTLGKKARRATVFVSGLGYYELWVNGRKVGDHVLDPGTTYYNHDQPFDVKARVLYVTHDVIPLLEAGANAVGVMLGHGWYSAEDDIPRSPSHREPYGDRPRLVLQMRIDFEDGERLTVTSNETWKTAPGPVTYNDYSNGETYDARLEPDGWSRPGFDDSTWEDTVSVTAPNGRLAAQMLTPIRVVETLKPVKMLTPQPGVFIFDMGKMLSGWTRLRVRGKRGAEVKLRHAARVHDDGTLDARSNSHPRHVARQTDTYILKGEGDEVWEPRFTLHGFRYVEVTGFPGTPTLASVEGRFVRSAVAESSTFACSNDLLNHIHDYVKRTFACSLQSIPQDAMDRSERVAWLGDPGMVAEDMIYNFDLASFWTKWLGDIRDAQKPDGEVPYISPIHWRTSHNPYGWMPVWHSTYPLIAWYVYQYYGDERILADHYEGLCKLVDYFSARAENHLLRDGLGDHMEPQPDGTSSFRPLHTPATLTSTAYYYYDTWILAQAAKVLGKEDDAQRYSELAEKIKAAFNREFLDRGANQYGTGSQTANALALYLGLSPERRAEAIAKNLVSDIVKRHRGHLSTGIIGTNALEQALPEVGAADVMYGIATQTTFPSWGYQVGRGATTLWEIWEDNPERQPSLNMKMQGSSQKFFYKDLAGISPASPGYRDIMIKPRIVGDLTWVKATVHTVHGPIAIHWERAEDGLDMRLTLPANTSADVTVPTLGLDAIAITESGQPLWRDGEYVAGITGITSGHRAGDSVTFQAGGGRYFFRLRGEQR